MRGFIFLISFFMVSELFASSLQEEWKLTSNMDDVKVWLLKSNVDVTAAFQTSTPEEKIDWSKVEKENFFKSFEENKRNSLKLMGISNWKATSYKWTKVKNGYELVVLGSYTDSSKQNVSFKETQIYTEDKSYQILNTWPTSFASGEKISNEFVQNLKSENKNL